jgi:Flp pilus assembly protein TadD
MTAPKKTHAAILDLDAAINTPLAAGHAHFAAGRLGPAEEMYNRVLQAKPDHAEALHCLGRIAQQRGKFGEAVMLSAKAVDASPDNAAYWHQLGLACRTAGDEPGAERCII